MSPAPFDPTAHLSEDQCLDLVHGLAPPEARDAWLAHLRTCAACEALLRECNDARESARARMEPALAKLRTPRRRAYAAWGVVAAAAALIAITLLLLPHREPPALASHVHALPANPELTALRGAAPTTADAHLRRGLAAYGERHYGRAAEEFAHAEATGSVDAFRRVYLANALAKDGRFAEAEVALESVTDASLPEPWHGETAWLRCVLAFAAGDAARCDSLASALARQSPEMAQRVNGLRAEIAREAARGATPGDTP